MRTKIGILTLIIALSGTVAAAENSADSHTQTTDAAGTTVSTDKTRQESVGLTGTHTIKDETKIVQDPRGLGNKVKQTTRQEVKVRKDGDVVEESTTVDAAGTERSETASTETSRNLGGGQTRVTTRTSVVDPRGMLNKRKVEIEEKEKVNADGTSKTYKKTVNGRTVNEQSESR